MMRLGREETHALLISKRRQSIIILMEPTGVIVLNFVISVLRTVMIPTRPSEVENRFKCKTFLVVIGGVAIGLLGVTVNPLRVLHLEGIIDDPNLVNIRRQSPETRWPLPAPHGCCSVRPASLYLLAINISSPLNDDGTLSQIVKDTAGPIPYYFVADLEPPIAGIWILKTKQYSVVNTIRKRKCYIYIYIYHLPHLCHTHSSNLFYVMQKLLMQQKNWNILTGNIIIISTRIRHI
jgi:hypothetical protein